jgi:hypothetical protein
VFNRGRAVAAGLGIVLATASRIADYLRLPTNNPLSPIIRSPSVAVIGYVAIGIAVFWAWKVERDRIEALEHQPILGAHPPSWHQVYAGGMLDLVIPLTCLKGEMFDAVVVVYANFGHRLNALPQPESIRIGHLIEGQTYQLKPSRMILPSGITDLKQLEGKGFDFECELSLNYTSAWDRRRYESMEIITYDSRSGLFDVRRPQSPRLSDTVAAIKRRRRRYRISQWLKSLEG